jgi:ATP-binding cassette subfamily C protein
VDSAIANWRGLIAARSGWGRLAQAIATFRRPPERHVTLDRPRGELVLRDLWVAPPGTQRFTVQGVSLLLQPGQALAVIGPSAAGKTSLVRGILGIWHPVRGEVRLDGATPDQWDAEALGSAIGYVPQTVDLIDGTVGQNIARFDPAATSEAVIAAARAASLHDAILALPDGYDTLFRLVERAFRRAAPARRAGPRALWRPAPAGAGRSQFQSRRGGRCRAVPRSHRCASAAGSSS